MILPADDDDNPPMMIGIEIKTVQDDRAVGKLCLVAICLNTTEAGLAGLQETSPAWKPAAFVLPISCRWHRHGSKWTKEPHEPFASGWLARFFSLDRFAPLLVFESAGWRCSSRCQRKSEQVKNRYTCSMSGERKIATTNHHAKGSRARANHQSNKCRPFVHVHVSSLIRPLYVSSLSFCLTKKTRTHQS